MKQIQILVPVTNDPTMIAGIPAIVRTAHEIHARGAGPIFLCVHQTASEYDWRSFSQRVPAEVIGCNGSLAPIRQSLSRSIPLLVLSSDGIPTASGILAFLEQAQKSATPVSCSWEGRPVGTYYPDPADFLNVIESEGFAPRSILAKATSIPAPADFWMQVETPEQVRAVENSLYRGLTSASDGYLARLDRRISISISRKLVNTPVTPNQITTASLALGLIGAALIAQNHYWIEVIGALLLWACCILDGCDGEVARLKLLCSPEGARYDVACDNISHVAIFTGIAIHWYLGGNRTTIPYAAFAMVGGMLMSMFTVWWLILRKPESKRPHFERVFERLASRDYVYLVLILVFIRHLDWFLGAVAVGSNLFWVSLWMLSSAAGAVSNSEDAGPSLVQETAP